MADQEGATVLESGARRAPRWIRSTWRQTPRMAAGYDHTREDETLRTGDGVDEEARRFDRAPSAAPAPPRPGFSAGGSDVWTAPCSATILINNFNYRPFVETAIASALAQTHPAQVVVVDDGSTDGSQEVIAAFGDRVRAVYQRNGGQASAMNEGFRLATGDVVVFLDSDDFLEPHAVETLLSGWRPGTVLGQYPLTIVDVEGTARGVYPDPPHVGLADGNVREQLVATGSYPVTVTSGLAFARTVLDQVMPIPVGPFRNAADGYLTRAVAFLGRVQRFDERLGSYRQHGCNDSDVCAPPGGLAGGFRKKIRYAENEFFTTSELAIKHGLRVVADLGEHDPNYIGYRLFSLLLDPESHPLRQDRRWPLLRRYVAARWQSAWPIHRKILALTLATAASLSTSQMSTTWIRWLHDSSSRPSWLRALAPTRR